MTDTARFAAYARPELARLFRSLNLDASYRSGSGDYLVRDGADGAVDRVLDLVGGAGASLFGHNHPALVEVARRCLDESVPFNAQGSVRTAAAELAQRLSDVVGEATGASYVVTLGNSGAEAVEAAMKHAAVERSRRLGAVQEELERSLRSLRRDGTADLVCADGPAEGRRCEDVVRESLDTVARLREESPVFVSLQDAFHGKTSGAGTLTHGANVPSDLHLPGPRRHRLHDWTPAEVVTALDAERVEISLVTVDPTGVAHSTTRVVSRVAACFAEPIQGEAGVREVPDETLAALRELADRHEAPLVFDEIQCGMGRTGTFLASEPSGVVADYYLLSKSLGGGLAKISAMLVATPRYVADFGRHHTSTFAEDDFSARIALKALDLAHACRDRIVELGSRLRDRLVEVARRWPDAIAEVRGRGLLLGVEFRLPRPESQLLREVFDSESLGYLIAGRLLRTHGIRVIPTLSAPTTLRVQPSAVLEFAEIDRIAEAFDEVAGLLSKGDYATLLEHLTVPAQVEWRPRSHVPAPRSGATSAPRRRGGLPRAVFLANLDTAGTLRALAPELGDWSDEQCSAAIDRLHGEADPFEVVRRRVTSPTGAEVEVSMVAVPFTAAQAVEGLRAGHGPWLKRTVLDAVDLAVSLRADVIGLGGYTSIVTDASRAVVEDEVRVTSGNSLTAACAYDLLRSRLAGIEPGRRRVGLVGAMGNIGAVMAELIAPYCESLVLVGRRGSGRRLGTVAKRLEHLTDVSISEDSAALRDCPTVVTATNSAEPVITEAHLADDGDVLVCDLAVPGDVAPSVARRDNVTLVSGGRIQLPDAQRPHFPGITLPPGILYSCMAETILLGFEPDTPSPSYGGLSVSGVLAARDLAARHGLYPARIVGGTVTSEPWTLDEPRHRPTGP